MSYTAYLSMAEKLARDNDCKLLYLCLFGSHLYGTSTSDSDIDMRGLFLPSSRSLALQEAKTSLHDSTGDDESRNSAEDVDIDLWSLQYWLFKLLPAGDTGAMDLFFSPSHKECVLYRDPVLDKIFSSPEKLLDLAGGQAYTQYALGQAKKYGIKGSRLGAIKQVHKWLEANSELTAGTRLGDILERLAADCADGRYCAVETIHTGEKALQLCGKYHVVGISTEEFSRRVNSDMNRYGARAEQAERNEGVDCKAISHALRALDQMEELLHTGRVSFPLRTRKELMEVKRGDFTWQEMEPMVLERLKEIDRLREGTSLPHCYDATFAREQVLAAYGLQQDEPVPAARICPEGRGLPHEVFQDVCQRLNAVEKEHDVRILYACESGSRAWGFPSRDSDFDIRFIYAHDEDWYLDIRQDKKDVIELGVITTEHGVLDINGWDLRKAFHLLVKSNAQILEWLDSPTVILDRFAIRQEMRQLTEKGFDHLAVWYHYSKFLHNCSKAYRNRPGSKRFLYMLRALLCLSWMESNQSLPPMSIDRLLPGVKTAEPYLEDIRDIIRDREEAEDHASFHLPDRLRRWVVDEMERLEEVKPSGPANERRSGYGAAFRRILRQTWA